MLPVLGPVVAFQRHSRSPLLLLAIMGAFAAEFMAIKLLPGLAFTGLQATVRNPGESYGTHDILVVLFSPDERYRTAYITILFGGLALLEARCGFAALFPG